MTTPPTTALAYPAATPPAVAPTSAPNAPARIAPSSPMLISPARSTSTSPYAASMSGVAVRIVAARNGSTTALTLRAPALPSSAPARHFHHGAVAAPERQPPPG